MNGCAGKILLQPPCYLAEIGRRSPGSFSDPSQFWFRSRYSSSALTASFFSCLKILIAQQLALLWPLISLCNENLILRRFEALFDQFFAGGRFPSRLINSMENLSNGRFTRIR